MPKGAGPVSAALGRLTGKQVIDEIERRQAVAIGNAYAMALCLKELSRPERYRDELGFASFEALLAKHEHLPSRMSAHKWFTVIETFKEEEVRRLGGMEKCYTLIRSMKLTRPGADPREVLKEGARVLGVKVNEASGRQVRELLRKRPRRPKVATKDARRTAERLRNGFRRVRVAAKMRVHVHEGAPCVETHLPAKSAAELVTVLKTAQPFAGAT